MKELLAKLPIHIEGVLFAVVTLTLEVGSAYIKNTPQDAITWQGLGLAITIGLADAYSSKTRLHQPAPAPLIASLPADQHPATVAVVITPAIIQAELGDSNSDGATATTDLR